MAFERRLFLYVFIWLTVSMFLADVLAVLCIGLAMAHVDGLGVLREIRKEFVSFIRLRFFGLSIYY